MSTELKEFWTSVTMIVLITLVTTLLWIFIKPLYVALIVFILLIIWKFPKLKYGLKYYWDKILSCKVKKTN